MALLGIIPAHLDNQGNCIIIALADIVKYFTPSSSSHAAPQNCGPRCVGTVVPHLSLRDGRNVTMRGEISILKE